MKDTENGMEALTTDLSDSGRLLPVFSFKEEAEMYLCMRGSLDEWLIRELAPEKLRSLFDTVLGNIVSVTLDPIPENSFFDASGLLSITRRDFIARLQGANSRLRLA
jgi:hypothetical protein